MRTGAAVSFRSNRDPERTPSSQKPSTNELSSNNYITVPCGRDDLNAALHVTPSLVSEFADRYHPSVTSLTHTQPRSTLTESVSVHQNMVEASTLLTNTRSLSLEQKKKRTRKTCAVTTVPSPW